MDLKVAKEKIKIESADPEINDWVYKHIQMPDDCFGKGYKPTYEECQECAVLASIDGRQEPINVFCRELVTGDLTTKSIPVEEIKIQEEKMEKIETECCTKEVSSNGKKYIDTYRKMLTDPNTLPSKMKALIEETGSIGLDDLRKACVAKLGCKSANSGSIGASLRILELEGLVKTEGRGKTKTISKLA